MTNSLFTSPTSTGSHVQLEITFTPEHKAIQSAPPPTPLTNLPPEEVKELLRSGTWEERQTKATALIEDALTRIEASLAAGHSESFKAFIETMGRFHRYSFLNQLLIVMQNPQASHVAGFNAWKAFERSVKPGERGIVVMAPIIKKVGETEQRHDDGTVTKEVTRQVVNVKPVYVFDVSQTEGKEIPSLYCTEGEVGEFNEKLKEMVQNAGIEVVTASNLGRALGSSEGKRIRLSVKLNGAQKFRVLTHEYAHELLHRGEDRMNTTRQMRELEAESVACVVCYAFGIDTVQSSVNYLHLYRASPMTLPRGRASRSARASSRSTTTSAATARSRGAISAAARTCRPPS